MNIVKSLLGKEVEVEISGKTSFSGILIDLGLDILLLFDGKQFLYIPLIHLHTIKERMFKEIIESPPENLQFQNIEETISYRKILSNAKGQFLEIFVTGDRSIHGYITNVLNDYIVFYSPVYKTMFISMQHIKWLTPYSNQLTPYTLSNEDLPVVPSTITLHRSFEEQIKKHEKKLLVFDMGDNPNKVGLLKSISNNIVELITANGDAIYWKLVHLKTVHMP